MNIPLIQQGKAEDEVKQYLEAFLFRYQELNKCERIVDIIDETDKRVEHENSAKKILDIKLARHNDKIEHLSIIYGTSKGKVFTEDEDVFLLSMVHKHGYGNWDRIRFEIRNSWLFRFDWFFMSRTNIELQRRCDILLKLVDAENSEILRKKADVYAAALALSASATSQNSSGDTAVL